MKEKKEKKVSRRAALGTIAGAVLAGGAALAVPPGLQPHAHAAPNSFPWAYHKLDPKAAGEPAYWGYYNGGRGCCYGTFVAIIGTMAKKYGAPYNSFPLEMMTVGKSGVGGWGTICGALLGAASAMALFHDRKHHVPLINGLFRWYETTAMPTYIPPKPKVSGQCEALVPGSVLCHISASTWSQEAGYEIHHPLRSERCARVTAEVAIKAVEILNAAHDKTYAFAGFGEEQANCQSCHSKGKEADHAKGKMHCVSCHSDLGEDHPN